MWWYSGFVSSERKRRRIKVEAGESGVCLGERARLRCYFSSLAGVGRVYGRKVRLQARKRADGKERAQKRYLAAQVPLTFQLARVWWRRGLSVHEHGDDRRMM